MIINGDLKQTKIQNNGLYDLRNKISIKYSDCERYENGISLVELKTKDIQRHKMIEKILDLYD